MARARDEEDSDIEVEDAANQVEDEPEDNEGEEDEEEEEFEIETILESKSDAFGKGNLGYLVKWKGYAEEHNSWVRPEDAGNAQDLIDEFWRARNAQKAAAAGRKSVTKSASVATKKRRTSVSMSDEEEEPAPKKRGRPPKAKSASDDEAPKSKSAPKKPAKINGTTSKKPTRTLMDDDEVDEMYEDMTKWQSAATWSHLVDRIDTVERQEDGELYVYFKLKSSVSTTKDRLCKEPTRICKKKMPELLLEFYEQNLRWRALEGHEEA